MKITLEKNAEQIDLIKRIGSDDRAIAGEAQEAFASMVGGVAQEVLRQAGTAGRIFTDIEYDENENPSIPFDLFYNKSDGHVKVWSQNTAGGLPSSQVSGMDELKFQPYTLDSAVNVLVKWMKKGRLDVAAKAIEWMTQELLVKQERNAWAVLLKALAEGSSNGADHILAAGTANVLKLEDLNKLLTLSRRINDSFASGTPANFSSKGITDLFVSPEITEQIRGFTYQPMNTLGAAGASVSGTNAPTVALDDATRRELFTNAGAQELYGIIITEMIEFGISQKYNTLFDVFSSVVPPGGGTFATATDEVLVGMDLTRDTFFRPVATQAEGGGQYTTMVDDQFTLRSGRVGWFTKLEEGRVVGDARALTGLIV
jgi:hypothetical protein